MGPVSTGGCVEPNRPAARYGARRRRGKAVWFDQARWKVSKKGNRYIVIDRIGVCVVITHSDEGYWSWEIRWRDGREPVSSNWTYVSEKGVLDEALDAVLDARR
jgi:hypothetical protein